MFYNKLQGTTSSSFRLGKNGVNIETLQGGELRIVTNDYEFVLGKSEVEGLLEDGAERTIASWQVVQSYIIEQVSGITGDVSEVDELLQQISGIAAALDNDPDFYLHVLRLQDSAGDAVDGQSVKGTTTFEKDVTFGGKIIGPSTLTIDPLLVDTEDPENPNLGTVVIHGNLQIDGVTTTINSQTVDIVDKNITLAVGSTNAAAADGAGISIEGAGVDFVYDDSDDSMNLNKNLNVDGELSVTGVITSGGERVVTGAASLSLSTGDAITDITIDEGELIFQTDNFVTTGDNDQTINGLKTFAGELNADDGIVTTTLESTVASGTSPFTVASNTVVANLNADKLDGADLETTVTDSDTKVPTSKAVLTYGVPRKTGPMPTLTFSDARKTTEKNNKYVYVYDESTDSSQKIPLSELHRPSSFIIDETTTGAGSELMNTKIGDFVYIK